MSPLIACIALLGGAGDALGAREVEARLLAAAGCRVVASGAHESFVHPHLVDARWSIRASEAGALELAPLSRNGWIRSDAPFAADDAASSWRASIAPAELASAPLVLELAQVGSSALARGEIRVRAPLERPFFTLDSVASGCSMAHEFELPRVLTSETTPLAFAWDLHSPVTLAGLCIELASSDATLAPVPIVLRAPDHPLQLSATALRPGDAPETVVARANDGGELQFERVHCPPCVELVEATEFERELVLRFRASPIAGALHACSPVLVDARISGDPAPFSRRIDVVHARPSLADDGARRVAGVFGPGETIELWVDGAGEPRLAHPDRLPCAGALLAQSGAELAGRVQAPAQMRDWQHEIATARGVFRIVGPVEARTFDAARRWFDLCAR